MTIQSSLSDAFTNLGLVHAQMANFKAVQNLEKLEAEQEPQNT